MSPALLAIGAGRGEWESRHLANTSEKPEPVTEPIACPDSALIVSLGHSQGLSLGFCPHLASLAPSISFSLNVQWGPQGQAVLRRASWEESGLPCNWRKTQDLMGQGTLDNLQTGNVLVPDAFPISNLALFQPHLHFSPVQAFVEPQLAKASPSTPLRETEELKEPIPILPHSCLPSEGASTPGRNTALVPVAFPWSLPHL